MNFWIAYASVFVAWWALYFFFSDKLTDAGIDWINAINPQSDAQYSLASRVTIAKHILFAILMIVALIFLARHYPCTATGRTGSGSLGMFSTGPW